MPKTFKEPSPGPDVCGLEWVWFLPAGGLQSSCVPQVALSHSPRVLALQGSCWTLLSCNESGSLQVGPGSQHCQSDSTGDSSVQ